MAGRGSRALRPGGSAGRGTLGNHTASAERPRERAWDSSFRRIAPMLDSPAISKFAHVKPADTEWRGGGLRDFFLYRDLGVADATGGRVVAHLVRANEAPEA